MPLPRGAAAPPSDALSLPAGIWATLSHAVAATRLRRRLDPLREDRFTAYATGLIAELRGEVEKVPMAEEPLVEIGEEDGVLDVGVGPRLA